MRIALTIGIAGALAIAAGAAEPLRYEVRYRDALVATQLVTLGQSADGVTVRTEFEADLMVFIARHHLSESISATVRGDGTVLAFEARRVDGGNRTDVRGAMGAGDVLEVVREDRDGISTNYIQRGDYDFHSLAMYGADPASFLPTNQPARVLNLIDGRVKPVTTTVISESITFERQHLPTLHVIWSEPGFTSHSWHPERFSNLPSRHLRQDISGDFDFRLLR